MKNAIRLYAVAAMLLSYSAIAADGDLVPFDINVGFNWISPGRSGDWDRGAGLDVQARFWKNEHLGIAFMAGAETWDAVSVVSDYDDGRVREYTAIDGDISATVLGVSLLYRSSGVFLDLGVRYMNIDSSVFVEYSYDGPGEKDYRYDTIKIDDTLLFSAKLGFELELVEGMWLVPSIGYQVDLRKPTEKFAGQPIGETDFRGMTLGVGISCTF